MAKEHRWVGGPLLLGAAILLVYGSGLQGTFLFDDVPNIVENERIRSLAPRSWFSAHPRPFVHGTFAVNYALSGLDVLSYHLVNLGIHVACAWLAFALLRRRLRCEALAGLMVLIWAVHPLHTTVVQYVVHRYESCATLGILLAVYGFERGLAVERRRLWWALSLFGALLAYGSKEVAIVLPALLLLYDRAYHANSFREALRRRFGFHALTLGCAVTLVAYVLGAPKNSSQGFGLALLSPLDYARSQLGVLPYYARLAVWPDSLSFDYSDWPIARSLREVAFPGVLTILGLLATAGAWLRSPRLGFPLVSAFLVLAPTSTFLPLHGELVAERRMYLPLLLVLGVVGFAFEHALERFERSRGVSRAVRRGALGLGVVVVVALGIRTGVRTRDFSDEVTAYGSVVRERPGATRIRYMLARALQVRGDLEGARREYRVVLEQDPHLVWAHNNLGVVAATLGDFTAAEAAFLQALRLLPREVEARVNLIECRIRLGKFEAARKTLRRGLELHPDEPRLIAKLRRLEALGGASSATSSDEGITDHGAPLRQP